VLAWIVEGAVKWFKAGEVAELPKRIVADTRAWRSRSDVVAAFLDERVEWDPASHVIGSDLLIEWNDFLRGRGQREWSEKLLVSRVFEHREFRDHNVERKRLRSGTSGLSQRPSTVVGAVSVTVPPPAMYTGWSGLRFREPPSPPDDAAKQGTEGDHRHLQSVPDPAGVADAQGGDAAS
jgi:hypothetical protein